MMKNEKEMKKFKFYTYDSLGRDVIIPIIAASEEAAWDEIHFLYNKNSLFVDQVICEPIASS
jgi:hypothetical protein